MGWLTLDANVDVVLRLFSLAGISIRLSEGICVTCALASCHSLQRQLDIVSNILHAPAHAFPSRIMEWRSEIACYGLIKRLVGGKLPKVLRFSMPFWELIKSGCSVCVGGWFWFSLLCVAEVGVCLCRC